MCLALILQGSLVSCLLSLLQQMEEGHYKHTWEGLNQSMKGHDALRTFLLECFLLFQVLIAGSVFPASWQLMRLKAAQIMLNAMQVTYLGCVIGTRGRGSKSVGKLRDVING